MKINRNNYEEFFVLYIDNELNAAERNSVEIFLDENPDLKTELEMLQQTILPAEEPVSFFNKEILFRSEADPIQNSTPVITDANCEEYFVMYGDNELSNDENALVEDFIYRHPQYQEHFELIQQVKYQPEKHIVFPNKSTLYRSERDRKVVPLFPAMRAWKMAAAAAVMLMIGGSAWYVLKTTSDDGTSGAVAGRTEVNNGNAQPNNGQPDNGQVGIATNNDTNNTGTEHPGATNTDAQNSATLAKENNAAEKKGTNTTTQPIQQPGITEVENSKPQLAAVNGSQDKRSNKSATNQLAPKAAVTQQEKAPVQQYAQAEIKKLPVESNISKQPNVTHKKDNTEPENKKMDVPVVENKVTNESMAFNDNNGQKTDVAIGPVTLPENNVFAKMANDNDEEFETSDRKNRARGFFRKVSRVFDKATSKEPSENRKGLHIASFAINLK